MSSQYKGRIVGVTLLAFIVFAVAMLWIPQGPALPPGLTLAQSSGGNRSTGGGGGVWGTITGTLSNQTDLQTALNAKSSISGLTTGFFPKAGSATSIVNSLCDEAITTANTFTCTDTAGIASPAFTSTTANGGADGTEGTGAILTAATGHDLFWPDSTAHRWKMNNNNGGAVTIMSTSDVLLSAQMPTFTGDLTNSGLAMTIASLAVTGAKMASGTVTATQLAAQYSKGSCTELWGGSGTSFALTAGDDAVSNNSCYNDSGVTRTITAVKCRSDNASNTTTVNPTFGAAGTGTTILSGALTCGSSLAYSSTGTVSNSGWTTGTGITPAMSGTLTGTSIAMIVEYTF